ncbi:MAG TPA: hypothetical protein VMI31_05040 [Fimbriimonadaceae bacterium]|nr:hypothetical protein [Fimbriimonadaceae bacterium]
MTTRTKALLLLVTFAAATFLAGCSVPQVGEKPGEQFNSALSTHQRAVLATRRQQRGE